MKQETAPTKAELIEAIYAKRLASLGRLRYAGAPRSSFNRDAKYRPVGIALKILAAAYAGPIRRDGEMARRFGIHASSINGSTSTLVTHGMVTVSDDLPAIITITEAGRAALEKRE